MKKRAVDAPIREVVHVGPGPAMQGGIAVAITRIIDYGSMGPYSMRRVATLKSPSGVLRHVGGIIGVLHASALAVLPGRRLFHLHVSIGGSFWRKALVLLVCRASGTLAIVHIHGSSFDSFSEGGTRFRRGSVRWFLRSATGVVVLSCSWAKWVEAFSGVMNAVVVPNPVDIPEIPSFPVSPPIVVFSGRLGSRKGIPELLAAASRVRERGFSVCWILLGDGEVAETRLAVEKRGLTHDVQIAGWIDQTGLREWLSRAAVFCLPSHAEGLPLALLEAMAYGLAPVVTPVGGIPELVRDEQEGLIVRVGDSEAIASAIVRLVSDESLRVRIGAAARVRVTELHSPEVVLRTLESMYSTFGRPDPRGFSSRATDL